MAKFWDDAKGAAKLFIISIIGYVVAFLLALMGAGAA